MGPFWGSRRGSREAHFGAPGGPPGRGPRGAARAGNFPRGRPGPGEASRGVPRLGLPDRASGAIATGL